LFFAGMCSKHFGRFVACGVDGQLNRRFRLEDFKVDRPEASEPEEKMATCKRIPVYSPQFARLVPSSACDASSLPDTNQGRPEATHPRASSHDREPAPAVRFCRRRRESGELGNSLRSLLTSRHSYSKGTLNGAHSRVTAWKGSSKESQPQLHRDRLGLGRHLFAGVVKDLEWGNRRHCPTHSFEAITVPF
jgi:hypothetical protein